MQRSDAIHADGVIVAALGGCLFQVKLANGHQILGFPPRRARNAGLKLAIGDRVKVRLSLFDLSKGRLVLNEND